MEVTLWTQNAITLNYSFFMTHFILTFYLKLHARRKRSPNETPLKTGTRSLQTTAGRKKYLHIASLTKNTLRIQQFCATKSTEIKILQISKIYCVILRNTLTLIWYSSYLHFMFSLFLVHHACTYYLGFIIWCSCCVVAFATAIKQIPSQ